VATSPDPNLCACGRTFRRIPQVSGRLVDCLRLPGGRLLSPYTITLALESVQGLNRYQVLQEQSDVVIVRYESRTTDTAMSAADAVRRALSELVGKDVRIDVCREDTINPPAGQKFRVVESRIHGA
jgi:phenylacetate-coenzyme A ligase PaaK-like adenylate-forming protein